MGAGFSTSKIPRDVNQRNRPKTVFVRGLIIFKIPGNSPPVEAGKRTYSLFVRFRVLLKLPLPDATVQ
jgi:hypothetical protein